MSNVTLSDLKQMGKIGGYTIRLHRKFPFSYTNGRLKHDFIEFTRIGVVNGRKQEICIREAYTRELLAVIDSIMLNKTLVARRSVKNGQLVLSGKGYRHVN
ncbi:hypothetical protein [Streptococcus suis]